MAESKRDRNKALNELKHKRIAYLASYIIKLRAFRKFEVVLFVLCLIAFLCFELMVMDKISKAINTKESIETTNMFITVIGSIGIPYIVFALAHFMSKVTDTAKLIIECEREIYQQCEYLIENDVLSIEEKQYHEKYTTPVELKRLDRILLYKNTKI